MSKSQSSLYHTIHHLYLIISSIILRWGIPGIGYLQRGKDRPHLFYVHGKACYISVRPESKLKSGWLKSGLKVPDGAIKTKVSKLHQGERDSENLLGSRNLLIENWLFLDSPHFTVNVKQVILLSLFCQNY